MDNTASDSKEKGSSKSSKAGLTFPVSRFQRYLRKGNYANKIGTAGSVYLTGVIEYLVAEILELSGSAAKENKRLRIIPRHVMLAIKNDVELAELLKDALFSESGVMPNIHPALHSKNKSKPKTVALSHNDDYEDEEDEEDEEDDDGADGSVVAGSQNF
ncbi:histone H2A-beta, sperm-like [Bradysia coprophila]|uniref:histone H2A-beta, sperm-like n=1 Tax=Bradysia coprophila TaxID=38358 RepID=UPI00187DA4B6|nr:histone H2A-beta, sperm-like [Bradysia coprophila]